MYVVVYIYVIFPSLCYSGCVCVCIGWIDCCYSAHIASRRDGKFNIIFFIQSHPVRAYNVYVWCRKPHRIASVRHNMDFFFFLSLCVCVIHLQELKAFFGDKFAFWMLVKNVGILRAKFNKTKNRFDLDLQWHCTIEIHLVVVGVVVIAVPMVCILLSCWYKIRSYSRLHWIKMSQ